MKMKQPKPFKLLSPDEPAQTVTDLILQGIPKEFNGATVEWNNKELLSKLA